MLVDYDLDDGKGTELVRELKLHQANMPIVGISSHQNGNAALLAAGAVVTCSKMEFSRIRLVLDQLIM